MDDAKRGCSKAIVSSRPSKSDEELEVVMGGQAPPLGMLRLGLEPGADGSSRVEWITGELEGPR